MSRNQPLSECPGGSRIQFCQQRRAVSFSNHTEYTEHRSAYRGIEHRQRQHRCGELGLPKPKHKHFDVDGDYFSVQRRHQHQQHQWSVLERQHLHEHLQRTDSRHDYQCQSHIQQSAAGQRRPIWNHELQLDQRRNIACLHERPQSCQYERDAQPRISEAVLPDVQLTAELVHDIHVQYQNHAKHSKSKQFPRQSVLHTDEESCVQHRATHTQSQSQQAAPTKSRVQFHAVEKQSESGIRFHPKFQFQYADAKSHAEPYQRRPDSESSTQSLPASQESSSTGRRRLAR